MKLNKPYIYFWITALIIFLVGLFFRGIEENIDFNIHDTYIVIAKSDLATLISIIFSAIGLLYYTHYKLKIYLIKRLTSIHTYTTIGALVLFIFVRFWHRNDNSFPLFDTTPNYLFIIIIYTVIFVQALFILNSMISIYKHVSKSCKQ